MIEFRWCSNQVRAGVRAAGAPAICAQPNHSRAGAPAVQIEVLGAIVPFDPALKELRP